MVAGRSWKSRAHVRFLCVEDIMEISALKTAGEAYV